MKPSECLQIIFLHDEGKSRLYVFYVILISTRVRLIGMVGIRVKNFISERRRGNGFNSSIKRFD